MERTYREIVSSERTFSKLGSQLRAQLFEIQSSQYFGLQMWPCAVKTSHGTLTQNVLIAEASSYLRYWGAWPDELRSNDALIRVDDVQSVAESPNRLPAFYANKVYAAGEASMGSHEFSILFIDGTKYRYKAGSLVDFVLFPEGKDMNDIADVVPCDTGEIDGEGKVPVYSWCLFSL